VIAANGPDATDVSDFTLRTNEGESILFQVGVLDLAGGGLNAPHLREHLVSGVPITAYFTVQPDGTKLVNRYIDAPPQQ
jgi:hypothetical protein